MEPDGAKAIFEEARRLLVRQEADLDTLRSRTVTMSSAAAVAASLFAARLPTSRSTVADVALVLAVGLFALTVATTVWIVWPVEFGFSHGLHKWIKDLREGRSPTLTEWSYNLTRDFEAVRTKNQEKIRCRYNGLTLVCVLLGLQVVAWLVAII